MKITKKNVPMIRLCTTCAKIDVYLMCCVIILPNDKNVITNSVCLSTFVIKYYNEINFKDAQNQTSSSLKYKISENLIAEWNDASITIYQVSEYFSVRVLVIRILSTNLHPFMSRRLDNNWIKLLQRLCIRKGYKKLLLS